MNTTETIEEARAIVEAAKLIGRGSAWDGFKTCVLFYVQHNLQSMAGEPATKEPIDKCSKK